MLFNLFLLACYLTALTLYHLATITALYRFIPLYIASIRVIAALVCWWLHITITTL